MGKARVDDFQIRSKYQARKRELELEQYKKDRKCLKDSENFEDLRLQYQHVGGLREEVYRKQVVDLKKNAENGFQETISIITNQNLTHDTTLYWHTTAAQQRQALRSGHLRPQALTSKAIKSLGQYRKKVAERCVKSRIQSHLNPEKNLLVDLAQDRIEWLQGLERQLGHHIEPDYAQVAADRMFAELQAYIRQNKIESFDPQLNYSADDRDAGRKEEFNQELGKVAKANRKENIAAAKKLQELIRAHQGDAAWLQKTGNEEILAFIQDRIYLITRQTQGLNQVLTQQRGTNAYLRGDLNSYAEDLVKEVREHTQDWHNPVTEDHQLIYQDQNKKVIVDSDFHTDGSHGQLADLMLAVSEISGDNAHIEKFRGEIDKKTSATKWRHFRSYYDSNPYALSLFSSWRHFRGTMWNWLLSPFNLVETIFRGNNAGFVAQYQYQPGKKGSSPKDAGYADEHTDYYALTHRLHKQTDLSIKIGLEINKVFKYLLVEGLWNGLIDGCKQLMRLPQDLITDFRKKVVPLETVLGDLEKELKAIRDDENAVLGQDFVLLTLKAEDDLLTLSDDLRFKLNDTSKGRPILIKQAANGGVNYTLYHCDGKDWVCTDLSKIGSVPPDFEDLVFTAGGVLIERGDYSLTRAINRVISFHKPKTLTSAPDSAPALLTGDVETGEEVKEAPSDAVKAEEAFHFAQPAIPLTPYQSHGVLNGGVSGVNGFIDFFSHNMFAKHPFTALVSSFGAVMSFLAFFATPLAIKLFGKGLVQFLQGQGYIWTKEPLSASMAGAFTNYKMYGAGVEALLHGPDSWLSRGFSYFINDPAKAVTYTGLSWGLGYFLVYLVNIPWLSEELRSHIGNPPELSLVFGGAKFGVIGYHLFVSPHLVDAKMRTDYIEECVANYIAFAERRGEKPDQKMIEAVREHINRALVSLEKKIKTVKEGHATQSPEDKAKSQQFGLLLELATNKDKLSQLSPLLKAKLKHQLSQMSSSSEDERIFDKLLDPEKHAPKSTLRSFLGRVIGYVPTLARCVLSFLAGPVTWSRVSFVRPWKDLRDMLLDDLTSTTQALTRLVNKICEMVFDRLPRTLMDVFVNGIFARVASFFHYHGITTGGYEQSAKLDMAREKIHRKTTGRIMNGLAAENTAAHADNPEAGLNALFTKSLWQDVHRPDQAPASLAPLGMGEQIAKRGALSK